MPDYSWYEKLPEEVQQYAEQSPVSDLLKSEARREGIDLKGLSAITGITPQAIYNASETVNMGEVDLRGHDGKRIGWGCPRQMLDIHRFAAIVRALKSARMIAWFCEMCGFEAPAPKSDLGVLNGSIDDEQAEVLRAMAVMVEQMSGKPLREIDAGTREQLKETARRMVLAGTMIIAEVDAVGGGR